MKAMTAEDKKAIKEKNSKKNQAPKKNIPKSEKNMSSTLRIAILGMLTAISFIMAFTPLGFMPIGVLTITFMTIPVIVAATILSPRDSAIIGGIFGITSFIRAVSGAGGLTMLALFQIDPFLTFVLCVVPRVLEGWLGGLIFQGMKRIDKTKFFSYIVTSLSVPVMNTIFFVSTFYAVIKLDIAYHYDKIALLTGDVAESFKNVSGNSTSGIILFFVAMVGLQALIEAGVCFVIGTAVSKALAVALKKVKK